MSNPPPVVATAEEASRAPRSRGGRCCLWGCGCMVLLLILLVAIGWLGYLRFGAPWIEEQGERWLSGLPSIGSLLQLKDTLPIDGMTLAGGTRGSAAPADFPDDVWLPKEYSEGIFNTAEGLALARVVLPPQDGADRVSEIRRWMEDIGWQRTLVPDPAAGVALLFERDGRFVSYLLYEREERGQILIKVRSTGR